MAGIPCQQAVRTAQAKKIPGEPGIFRSLYYAYISLQRLDIRSLLAFWASGNFKRNALIFLQRFEAIRLDSREVSEQIFAAFVWRDETKTF